MSSLFWISVCENNILSFSRPDFCENLTWWNLKGLAELAHLTVLIQNMSHSQEMCCLTPSKTELCLITNQSIAFDHFSDLLCMPNHVPHRFVSRVCFIHLVISALVIYWAKIWAIHKKCAYLTPSKTELPKKKLFQKHWILWKLFVKSDCKVTYKSTTFDIWQHKSAWTD